MDVILHPAGPTALRRNLCYRDVSDSELATIEPKASSFGTRRKAGLGATGVASQVYRPIELLVAHIEATLGCMICNRRATLLQALFDTPMLRRHQ